MELPVTNVLIASFLRSMLLYVHIDRKVYWGRGAQDGHLDFHTAPELCCPAFSVALRPQRPYGLLGTGSPGRPPRLSHSS